jgi:hypothetical protein
MSTRSFAILLLAARAFAQTYGPYNASFIPSGLGLDKPMAAPPDRAWTVYCWVHQSGPQLPHTIIGGFGDRHLISDSGHPAVEAGNAFLPTSVSIHAGAWHFVAATYDGAIIRLFLDGAEVVSMQVALTPATVKHLQMAPTGGNHFAGRIARFTLVNRTLSPGELSALSVNPRNLDILPFEAASKSWPVQTRAQAGMKAPQDPSTLPQSPVAPELPVMYRSAPSVWRMIEAPRVQATGEQISQAGFATADWYAAIVPGTVLTTLIHSGVYPDPDYGLNNLAIPETLARQDYWYRREITGPPVPVGGRATLTFNGINYAAAVWLNGKHIGHIKGAFRRGIFDVTGVIVSGQPNALAVRISPPPHPGIAHEQSIKAGPGDNGGMLCLDGPTFICTEGWDWIPGIRDRDTGIWQDVTLTVSGPVQIGDVHVVTALSPGIGKVTLTVPLSNSGPQAVSGMVKASFEGFTESRQVVVPPGGAEVTFTPTVRNPRLWWPNGYGSPELYHLNLSFSTSGGESDKKSLRFGIREISYELSLLDPSGQVQRVEFSPTAAGHQHIVDVSHEGSIQTDQGWVASLLPGASAAIRPVEDTRTTPFLVIRVNGVRIAAKGGNWGISDSRKRVSRERLEPYVRMHRDAHLTFIRNWCGQSTEEALYDLADEYGLLVWNDFWQSTQDWNLEPDDSALFLDNVRDTLLRFRNHPSIAIWCGRNEGIPAPAVNEGMEALIRELDGTRYYMPSSRMINLQMSGPWQHGEPVDFFTTRARGFSTELGLPSVPTLETMQAMMPKPDQWPPSDTWAYHDWHANGNGGVSPFMNAMIEQLGAPSDLEDFERKAQMMNYVNHRAMFEGFNAHLWNPNSGRLMWMTHPAWPSMNWQLYSSDYDEHATFFGVKKACEPVHVQMNLPDLKTAVVNNTTNPLNDLSMSIRIFALDGKLLSESGYNLSIGPNTELDGAPIAQPDGFSFIKLELRDAAGKLLSENFYWQTARTLGDLPAAKVSGAAGIRRSGNSTFVRIELNNIGKAVALMTKLTLRQTGGGRRVLPTYAGDNYISLLPGERRTVEFETPVVPGDWEIGVGGWNVTAAVIRPARTNDSQFH